MQGGPASTLNPDAGFHAISADPREVAAAVRAGDESVRRVPYFTWRYGERGRRFGHSDSAWLANLAGWSQEQVNQQVAWLGVLLSARGMPQLLLERHLRVLHTALIQAVPERASDYAKLLGAADTLRQARVAVLDDASLAQVASTFEAAVGDEWAAERAGVGELLVAAVADEQNGVERAVASVTEWLADPARFSPTWIAAVHQAVAQARARCRPAR